MENKPAEGAELNGSGETNVQPLRIDQLVDQTLYDIADEYLSLLTVMEVHAAMNGGVLPPQLDARFDQLSGAIEQKIVRCAVVLKGLDSTNDTVKAEIKRLTERLRERSRQIQGARDRLADYVARQMDRCDVRSVKGDPFDVRVQDNPPSVDAPDENAVPDEFCNVTVTMPATVLSHILKKTPDVDTSEWKLTRSVRRADIIKAWKADPERKIPGATVTQKRGLRVS